MNEMYENQITVKLLYKKPPPLSKFGGGGGGSGVQKAGCSFHIIQ